MYVSYGYVDVPNILNIFVFFFNTIGKKEKVIIKNFICHTSSSLNHPHPNLHPSLVDQSSKLPRARPQKIISRHKKKPSIRTALQGKK